MSVYKIFSNRTVVQYPALVMYLDDLIERKQEWAVCFRDELLVRGCHTNNYLEAQFLVLKDTILRRTRAYNINTLLEKLFVDFEHHFQLKLLSIADGSFDGIFRGRFKGISSSGYVIPSVDVQDRVLAGCVSHGENVFSVPSKTEIRTRAFSTSSI